MLTLTAQRSAVKTTVLFDATTHRNRLPFPSTYKRRSMEEIREETRQCDAFLGLTEADRRQIDAVRFRAFDEANLTMSESDAEDAAGNAAVAEFDRLLAIRRAQLTARPVVDDRDWWADVSNADATDYVVVGRSGSAIEMAAGSALAVARLSAGFAIL